MSNNKNTAPFQFEALRPFVSVTLHKITQDVSIIKENRALASQRIVHQLSDKLDSLFDVLEIDGKNPYNISTRKSDRGIIPTKIDKYGLSLTGVWFKRITAPSWLDAVNGPEEVRDVTNHILILAVRYPYLAVLATHSKTHEILSAGLEQGYCGKDRLNFIVPKIDQETLERAFVRGKNRVAWLSALHASIETKPDAKTLVGHDLRRVYDPFSDQTFTFTSAVNILPLLEIRRQPRYQFRDDKIREEYACYAFRVGVSPEQYKVWTLQTRECDHFMEELYVLFDTLDLPANREIIKDWCYYQDGFKFLGKPLPPSHLNKVNGAFDVGLDLPPPVQPGDDIDISSERERCRELWRAYGQMEVIPGNNSHSCNFQARVKFNRETIIEIDVSAQNGIDGKIELQRRKSWYKRSLFHEGVTCFETLLEEDKNSVKMTARYDSGHVIRGERLFQMGWEDVLFESWKWKFDGGGEYSPALEKPANPNGKKCRLPNREEPEDWYKWLGTGSTPRGSGIKKSLFQYLLDNAEPDKLKKKEGLFEPPPKPPWYLCCDDGPGEVADFVYFEPEGDRLYLIHIKSAGTEGPGRDISVKAYEEVVAQAIKNLRYLDTKNLEKLLRDGSAYPISEVCFHNGSKTGNRNSILKALRKYKERLSDKRVIVFQPHVKESVWNNAYKSWMEGEPPTPKNQTNRFLQLRTLLADAEITCRKIGAHFEVWGAKDENSPEHSTGDKK